MCHFSIKRTTILTFNFLNANFQQEMSVTFVNQIFISEKKKKKFESYVGNKILP